MFKFPAPKGKPKSSNVSQTIRDGDDLIVNFNNDRSYRYYGAGHHHDKMQAADSKGSYLHENIIGRHTSKELPALKRYKPD